jgi:hypothetical protein
MPDLCPDCLTGVGQLHELFCLKERCPFCRGQLVTCGCISTVLNLSTNEQKALDEYLDDETEPLRTIMARWKGALAAKGRVAFGG